MRTRLKAWREGANLSQRAAAEMVQADQSTWWDWEMGDKQPRLDQALAIEHATNGAIRAVDWTMTPGEREERRKRRVRRARRKRRPEDRPAR